MDNLYFNPKRIRKIKNKRNCKTVKIWGWILTALGAVSVFDGLADMATFSGGPGGIFDGLIFLIPGVALLIWAIRQVRKWDRYESLIDNKGNTSIPMLAERMNLPEKTVYADLHKMIGNDFFIGPNYNIESYIDGERDMLVMMVAGRPLKPLPEIKKEDANVERPPKKDAREDDPKDKDNEAAIRVEMSDLDMIRRAIAETSDDDARNSLYGIEASLRRIDERVQNEPQLKKKGSIKKLYKYYMPQIMELIKLYHRSETTGEVKVQIKEALNTSASALANIEADIIEKEQMDIEIDIQVLQNMFAQDGLLRGNAGGNPQGEEKPEVQTGASQ